MRPDVNLVSFNKNEKSMEKMFNDSGEILVNFLRCDWVGNSAGTLPMSLCELFSELHMK